MEPEEQIRIESEVFKAGKGRFAFILFERHGSMWLMGGVALLFTSILLGFLVDYRIFILALILVCLVAPAMLMILYFNYGMKGLNFLNVIDHKVIIDNRGLTVTLFRRPANEDKEDEGKTEPIDETEDRLELLRSYEFGFDRFGPYSVGQDYVVFPFVPYSDGFIYLPLSAFGDEKIFAQAVEMIGRKNKEINLNDENNKR